MGNKYKRPPKDVGPAKKKARLELPRKIAVQGHPDPALAAYAAWCTASGIVVSPKVAFSSSTAAGRGMFAVAPIQAGEVLFEIPRSLVIVPTAAHSKMQKSLGAFEFPKRRQPDDGADEVDADEVDADEVDAEEETSDAESNDPFDDALMGDDEPAGSGWTPLLLTLMHEFGLSTSFWRPYLNVLPPLATLAQPLFWDAAERAQLLQGHPLCQHTLDDIDRISAEYDECAAPFVAAHPALFPAGAADKDTYMRLAGVVMSYSFTDDRTGLPMMVPVADLLNHKTGHNNARLFYEKASLQMVTIEPIQSGTEVFNTYGSLSSADLLRKYGFVEPAENVNPFDDVEVTLNSLVAAGIPGSAELVARKQKFLIDRGFVFDGKDTFFVPIPDSAPPSISDLMDALHPRMQAVLNVAAMTEAELEAYECSNPVALESDDEDSDFEDVDENDDDDDDDDDDKDDDDDDEHDEGSEPEADASGSTSPVHAIAASLNVAGDADEQEAPQLVLIPHPVVTFTKEMRATVRPRAFALLVSCLEYMQAQLNHGHDREAALATAHGAAAVTLIAHYHRGLGTLLAALQPLRR